MIIESYKYYSEDIPVNVSITTEKGEYVMLYEISISTISKTTEILLEKVRQELAKKIELGTADITDIKKSDVVRLKFKETAIVLLKKYFPGLTEQNLNFFTSYLLQKALGLGRIEILLDDKNLEEIVINSSNDPVWVYHHKHGWLKTNIIIPSEDVTRHYANLVGRKVGRSITILNPLMDAQLETGERVNATLYPISTFGNTITLRKFAFKPYTITDFLIENTLSYEAAALIWLAVQYELSVLISGGTASGKTSCLNVVTGFIPPNQRVISIEDTREIKLPKHMHWVPMLTRLPNVEGKGEVCMFPGSWFVDGNGEIHEISSFVENLMKINKPQKIKTNVEVIPGDNYTVMAGNPLKFDYKSEKIKSFSKIKDCKKICDIQLEDGTSIKVTENTKIPTLTETGEVELLTPKELKKNDIVPILTKINIKGDIQNLNILDIFNSKRFYAHNTNLILDNLLNNLKRKYTLTEIADLCNIKKQTFTWYKKANIIRIDILNKILELSNTSKTEIEKKINYIKARGNTANLIRIPKKLDENLAYLSGFILAEKTLVKNGIFISQKEDIYPILNKLTKDIFNIKTIKGRYKDYHSYRILSVVISHLMKNVFSANYSKEIRVPKIIMRSPENIIKHFLAGYIDGDGSISKGRVSLASSNKDAIQEFKYLFLRLGILSRIYHDKKITQLNIHSRKDAILASKLPFRIKKNIKRANVNLLTKFGFPTKRNRIPYYLIKDHLNILKKYLSEEERYKYIYRYTNQNQCLSISRDRLEEVTSLLKQRIHTTPDEEESLMSLSSFLKNKNLEYIKIRNIKIRYNVENIPSYDITPEKSTYFIAGTNNYTLIMDTMLDLLVNSLRMRPDRIIVGEIRRKKEAEVLFEAIHTGHSVYATVHANDTSETITRLTSPPIDISPALLPALDMIVVMWRNRRTGTRRIIQVSEILKNSQPNVLMERDIKKDVLTWTSQSQSLFQTLKLQTGLDMEELKASIKEKEFILNYLVKNNINTVDAVGKIIANYYTNKDNLLKYLQKK